MKSVSPPPSRCCWCLSSAFVLPPSPHKFTQSHLLPLPLLRVFRRLSFLYLFVVGFAMEWAGWPTPGLEKTWGRPPRYQPNATSNDDDWTDAGNMPIAYLTNWGFMSTLSYFFLINVVGAVESRRRRRQLSKGGIASKGGSAGQKSVAFDDSEIYDETLYIIPNNQSQPHLNNTSLDLSTSSIMSRTADDSLLGDPYHGDPYHQQSLGKENRTKNKNKNGPPTTLLLATWYFFHLTTTLQPFIVLGFWLLVYPVDESCDFRCYTVHGAACLLSYLDLFFGKLTFAETPVVTNNGNGNGNGIGNGIGNGNGRFTTTNGDFTGGFYYDGRGGGIKTKRNTTMLLAVLVYPLLWLATQFAWIYTDHKPDYTVLQLDDLLSVYLTFGCFLFFCACFFLNGKLCSWRDYRWGSLGHSYFINGKDDSMQSARELHIDTKGPPAAFYDLSNSDMSGGSYPNF